MTPDRMTPEQAAAFTAKARQKTREDRKQKLRELREIRRELDAEERGPVTFPEALHAHANCWTSPTSDVVAHRRLSAEGEPRHVLGAIQGRQDDARRQPHSVATRWRSVPRQVCGHAG